MMSIYIYFLIPISMSISIYLKRRKIHCPSLSFLDLFGWAVAFIIVAVSFGLLNSCCDLCAFEEAQSPLVAHV
jgi:hypothetical protein